MMTAGAEQPRERGRTDFLSDHMLNRRLKLKRVTSWAAPDASQGDKERAEAIVEAARRRRA